ncbi:MAG TPA: hypothetical protein VMZ03_06860 [Chitinophagaceae bacterium]|nr:hypothetical protein [Chitinophagaceae bacterium]
MRYIYTLILSLCGITAICQNNSYMSMGYSLSAPQGKMNEKIDPLHSISANILFEIPGITKQIQLGAEAMWGTYASTSKEQTFNFGGGVSTVTNVNYSSNVLQGSLVAKYLLLKDKKATPYITAKAGYASFYSNIFIEDPHDEDGCKPLDQKNIIKDGTIFGGYGGGIQLDWSIFSPKASKKRGWIDLRVQNIAGGKIDYINTRKLIDASAPPPPGQDGKAVTVKFVNATTNHIHEHQVAEVYTTPLRMLEFKLSWVFVLE